MLLKISLFLLLLHAVVVCFFAHDVLYFGFLTLLVSAFIGSRTYKIPDETEATYYAFFSYCVLFFIFAELVSCHFIPYKFPHQSDPFYLFDTLLFFIGVLIYLRAQGMHRLPLAGYSLISILIGAFLCYQFFIKPYRFSVVVSDLGQLIYSYSDLAMLLLLAIGLKLRNWKDLILFLTCGAMVTADLMDFYFTVSLPAYPMWFTSFSNLWVTGLLSVAILPKHEFCSDVQAVLSQFRVLVPCLVLILTFFAEKSLIFEGFL